jgi:hypothetical protein
VDERWVEAYFCISYKWDGMEWGIALSDMGLGMAFFNILRRNAREQEAAELWNEK